MILWCQCGAGLTPAPRPRLRSVRAASPVPVTLIRLPSGSVNWPARTLSARMDSGPGPRIQRHLPTACTLMILTESADGQRLVTSTASAAAASAFRGVVCAGQGAQARAQQVDNLLRTHSGEFVRVEQVP